MYPRNAASPERIDIGAVVQISDGAVQTSGCTVRIIPAGGAEGDGAGTTAYSDDGVVLYTPTQAETNHTSFILIAKKPGCIPASKTVVTSANATAGKVTVGSNEDKTGYTASTVSDKTGYSLAAGHGLATEAKQDSILGYVDCLPATWVVPAAAGAAMTLTSGERTTLAAAIEAAIINELDGTAVMQAIADLIASDMTTTDLTVAAIASACRDAILNRVLSGNHDTAGTPGKLIQNLDATVASRATSTVAGNILDAVTNVTYGNQAIATAINSLPSADNIKTALEADGGKLDHVWETTEDNAGVRRFSAAALAESPTGTGAFTDDDRAALAAAKAVTDAMATMIVVDGAVYQFTENALEQAPSGSTAVTILPLQSTAGNTGRLSPIYLTAYQHCQIEATILVVDHEGNAVDLTGKTLSLVAWDADAPTVAVFELRSDGASPELTIGGASSNQVTIDGSDTHTATARELQWRLYNVTDDRALASGKLTIVEGAVGPVPT